MSKKNKAIELLLNMLLNEEDDGEQTEPTKLFKKGEKYFIRTVTYHAIGVCADIVDGFIVLNNAMWVADSGRLTGALKDGIEKQSSSELEVFPTPLKININAIVDFTEYQPKIVLSQK